MNTASFPCTLLSRAQRQLVEASPLLRNLALVPLALAPTATAVAQIAMDPGTIGFTGIGGNSIDDQTPLAPFGASNNTDHVKLAGSAAVSWDFSTQGLQSHTYTFENPGTFSASAGQRFRVDYDFTQSFVSSSGGGFDLGFELQVLGGSGGTIFTLDDLVSPERYNGSGDIPRTGSMLSGVFTSDISNESLQLTLTATFLTTDEFGNEGFDSTAITVPQNSIHLSVIPEPGPTMLVAVTAGFVAWRRFKRKLGRRFDRHRPEAT